MAKIKKRKKKKCKHVGKEGKKCKSWRMPDSNYCLNHGGGKVHTSKRKRRLWKNQIKHGQSSGILKKYGLRVTKLIEEVKRSKDYLDVDENVAVMTGIMRKTIERAEEKDGMDGVLDQSKPIFTMLEKINKAILTKARIEEGLKHKIDVETIDLAMKQMMGIINKHIKDPIIKRKMADEFDNIQVHDLPMKGHKPREEHLRDLEALNIDMRESVPDVARLYDDDDDWDDDSPTKIVFEMD